MIERVISGGQTEPIRRHFEPPEHVSFLPADGHPAAGSQKTALRPGSPIGDSSRARKGKASPSVTEPGGAVAFGTDMRPCTSGTSARLDEPAAREVGNDGPLLPLINLGEQALGWPDDTTPVPHDDFLRLDQ